MREEKGRILIALPFDEGSKRVIEALNNESARRILEALSEEPMSVSGLSSRLEMPITTIHYNIMKLLSAGLIRVKFRRMSEKRREVEYYEPSKRLIVIIPEKVEGARITGLIKGILSVASALGLSVGVGMLAQALLRGRGAVEYLTRTPKTTEPLPTPAPEALTGPVPWHIMDPWIFALIGGASALLVVMIWRRLLGIRC